MVPRVEELLEYTPMLGPGWSTAATLEVFLVLVNVATAVVAYPILKRESEIGAIGYVSAPIVEGIFIAIGVVSALAFLLMLREGTAADPVLGETLVATYYRAFRRAWLHGGSRERSDPGP